MKRLLYFCSFVPFQLLEQNGFQMICAYDYEKDRKEQSFLPGNPCSFIKACENIDFNQFDGVIFTNCCNSTQRLQDYIKYYYPNLFVYMLSLPRSSKESWTYTSLLEELKQFFKCEKITYPRIELAKIEEQDVTGQMLVISSSLSNSYGKQLTAFYPEVFIKFYTCQSQPRGDQYQNAGKPVFCVRMTDFVEQMESEIKGSKAVIFITMEKCDYIMFSYPAVRQLCKKYDIQFLHIEEEFTNNISENSKIRYEAFKECMRLR